MATVDDETGERTIPSCRDVSEMVTDYLEGAMRLRARAGVRVHLWQCDACRTYFDQMRKTIQLLAESPAQPPPPETEDRIAGQAGSERRNR